MELDERRFMGVAESGDDLKMLTLAVGTFRETSLRNSSLKSATPKIVLVSMVFLRGEWI